MLQEPRVTAERPYLSGNKPGAGLSIWFQCLDSLLLYHEFLDSGIKADEPFVGNGLWDLRVVDPDGYNLHFESKTDVAEETRYSEWRKSKKGI